MLTPDVTKAISIFKMDRSTSASIAAKARWANHHKKQSSRSSVDYTDVDPRIPRIPAEKFEASDWASDAKDSFGRSYYEDDRITPRAEWSLADGSFDLDRYMRDELHIADPPAVRAEIERQTLEYTAKHPITMRIPRSVLPQVLGESEILNMFQLDYLSTKKRHRGAPIEMYESTRRRVEENVVGLPSKGTDPSKRPVYGYLDDGDVFAANIYGNVKIEFHPHVKSRSTYTVGDSLQMAEFRGSPAAPFGQFTPSVIGPSKRMFYTAIAHGKSIVEAAALSGHEVYVEAQIFGPPPLSHKDIKSVHFGVKPKKAELDRLKALGIEWTYDEAIGQSGWLPAEKKP